jgi:hypothetical protein
MCSAIVRSFKNYKVQMICYKVHPISECIDDMLQSTSNSYIKVNILYLIKQIRSISIKMGLRLFPIGMVGSTRLMVNTSLWKIEHTHGNKKTSGLMLLPYGLGWLYVKYMIIGKDLRFYV